ncbi:peroxisomal membrane 22 kDa (Mpv17/PMP22) family protein [Tasmannia lanceolata]|uniref:peroxisomal membrane 22 kDa (Mpv17/PMP22) family protein n=1 Tax=Tasmannia lanceolata TaxID=3420 RepID=UPI0040630D83
MASVNSITAQGFLPIAKPIRETKPLSLGFSVKCASQKASKNRRNWMVRSVGEEVEVIPVRSSDTTDQQDGGISCIEREEEAESANKVGGFSSNQGRFSFEGGISSASSSLHLEEAKDEEEDFNLFIDRAINATIVLAAGTFAITKLLTIDRDYWHGWTIYEILRYAPLHNWTAYEEALKTNPVLAKMMISGVVYSVGDWIAQCYEGKPLFEFDRARMFRSGFVGFTLHGSLSHYYYHFCEALFPFQDWWVVPAKVLFDQTAWSAVWNSIYYVMLGLLRFESPINIYSELKATFWPLLTAGWKLWPFAHLITYGVVPVEQRLLWVDTVELVWVTILSTYSNEKSEARSSDPSSDTNVKSSPTE